MSDKTVPASNEEPHQRRELVHDVNVAGIQFTIIPGHEDIDGVVVMRPAQFEKLKSLLGTLIADHIDFEATKKTKKAAPDLRSNLLGAGGNHPGQ